MFKLIRWYKYFIEKLNRFILGRKCIEINNVFALELLVTYTTKKLGSWWLWSKFTIIIYRLDFLLNCLFNSLPKKTTPIQIYLISRFLIISIHFPMCTRWLFPLYFSRNGKRTLIIDAHAWQDPNKLPGNASAIHPLLNMYQDFPYLAVGIFEI